MEELLEAGDQEDKLLEVGILWQGPGEKLPVLEAGNQEEELLEVGML